MKNIKSLNLKLSQQHEDNSYEVEIDLPEVNGIKPHKQAILTVKDKLLEKDINKELLFKQPYTIENVSLRVVEPLIINTQQNAQIEWFNLPLKYNEHRLELTLQFNSNEAKIYANECFGIKNTGDINACIRPNSDFS
ncbi:MAG: hypothetical protein KBD37_01725 [Burkholderiales bacterium]|nr:hypothetical protein [Burkholderiales bacterium]